MDYKMYTCDMCKGGKYVASAPVCGDCLPRWRVLNGMGLQTDSPANVYHVDFKSHRPATRVVQFPGTKNVIVVDFVSKRVLGRTA